MSPGLPRAKELLGDKGFDSNRFRQALITRGIAPCIPLSHSRKVPIPYDRARYRHDLATIGFDGGGQTNNLPPLTGDLQPVRGPAQVRRRASDAPPHGRGSGAG